jgi:DNA-binding TFAR19-related protein (PDSD5 family)
MSDDELEVIRRRRLLELNKRLAKKESKAEISEDEVLNRIFRGRAWEVFNNASHQFPGTMSRVKDALVKLALAGKLKEVTGEQLYLLLKDLGLKVRLDTKIEFASHGELKSLAEKMKENLHS